MKSQISKYIFPILLIVFIYFAFRLQNLQSIPVFGDEAIYLRWSQLIKNVDTLRFVPQSDGKQPLFMWLTAVSYKIINDPLLAGRLISIFSGMATLITLYILCIQFFNKKVTIISSLLYILLPFTFFFDRLALPDNLLSFFGLLSMLLALLLSKYPRLDLSLLLGFALGFAWLTKSPAIYFVILTFLTFIIYSKANIRKIYFPVISSILGFSIYNILRLGPQFQQIALRNKDYVWSVSEIIKHPFDPLLPHLVDIFHIYSNYISFPLIILTVISLLSSYKIIRKNNTLLIISLWWILPTISNSIFAKVFTARYILFTLPALILIMSYAISQFLSNSNIYFKNSASKYLILFLCTIPNLFTIYNLSINPNKIKLSSTEKGYTSEWTSGWGIKTVSKYLIERSKNANVIVGTEGYFGTLPDGLQIYTDSLPQLTIFGVGIDIVKIPDKLIDARNHNDEVYLLFNQSRLKLTPTDLEKLSLISTTLKPDGDKLVLYRLN